MFLRSSGSHFSKKKKIKGFESHLLHGGALCLMQAVGSFGSNLLFCVSLCNALHSHGTVGAVQIIPEFVRLRTTTDFRIFAIPKWYGNGLVINNYSFPG